MSLRIRFEDLDSKWPNLALMKLSAYHKTAGDTVGFDIQDPELVYASLVFKRNRQMLSRLEERFPGINLSIGGVGYDLKSSLPPEIERLRPDYSLYDGLVCQKCGHLTRDCHKHHSPGNMFYSMGFTTRGCFRKCYFCVVPEKEGGLQRWQPPAEFHDPRFRQIMILDNNWLGDRDWFFETSAWIREKGLALRENGLDIRLLDPENAKRLGEMKLAAPLHFAFDSDKDAAAVSEGLKLLSQVGIDIRHRVRVYVYLHDNKPNHIESAKERCRMLKRWGTTALLMFNIDNKPNEAVRRIQRWTGKPWLYWKIDIDDYDSSVPHGSPNQRSDRPI